MGLRLAQSPPETLHRVGYPPEPLAWPPPEYRGDGRFDDPVGEFGVLYVAPDMRTCYLETLDSFRPDRALLHRLLAMDQDSFIPQSGLIPDAYFERLIGHIRLASGQAWLDVRTGAPETAIALSQDPALAAVLPELGYEKRFKPGDLVSSDRRLTQIVARWAFDHGYAGIAYSCSHDLRCDCWAISEGATFEIAGPSSQIVPDDPVLLSVAQQFGLTISFTRRR